MVWVYNIEDIYIWFYVNYVLLIDIIDIIDIIFNTVAG